MVCPHCNEDIALVTLKICSHQFCKKCLYYHIKNNLAGKIKCPNKLCNKNMKDRDIRQFLSNSDEYKYDKLCMGSIAKKCMTEICTFVYVANENELYFLCDDCLQPNCIKCNARHLPSNCGRRDLKSESERNSEAKFALSNRRFNYLQNYDDEHDLITSIDAFDCEICCKFTIPKEGVMLRCGCNYCRSCLSGFYESTTHFNRLTCCICDTEMAEIEKSAIMKPENIQQMSGNVIRKLMYTCKHADCGEQWFNEKLSGFTPCPKCNEPNCMSCQEIHKGQSCDEFKQTKHYKNLQACKKEAKQMSQTKCYKCKELLIKGKGCNAVPCPTCNVYTCLFKGIKAGPGGCECTANAPCDKECKYGCIIENLKPK